MLNVKPVRTSHSVRAHPHVPQTIRIRGNKRVNGHHVDTGMLTSRAKVDQSKSPALTENSNERTSTKFNYLVKLWIIINSRWSSTWTFTKILIWLCSGYCMHYNEIRSFALLWLTEYYHDILSCDWIKSTTLAVVSSNQFSLKKLEHELGGLTLHQVCFKCNFYQLYQFYHCINCILLVVL